MDHVVAFLVAKVPYWTLMGSSLGAGIVGAYGRERHEGRAPTWAWWQNRIMIVPFLAITAAWLDEQFNLSDSQVAMAGALLSLLGYEAVRMISEYVKKRGEQAGDVIGGKGTARPYHSLVDSDQQGRAQAHVEPTDKDHPRRASVGSALRDTFAVDPKIPDGDRDLLDRLNSDGV